MTGRAGTLVQGVDAVGQPAGSRWELPFAAYFRRELAVAPWGDGFAADRAAIAEREARIAARAANPPPPRPPGDPVDESDPDAVWLPSLARVVRQARLRAMLDAIGVLHGTADESLITETDAALMLEAPPGQPTATVRAEGVAGAVALLAQIGITWAHAAAAPMSPDDRGGGSKR